MPTKRVLIVISLIVFLEILCLGATVSTIEEYSDFLGGTALMLGLLWAATSGPKAISTPLWASLSDRWGRRPVLVIGTIGTILGSLMWGIGRHVGIVLAGRLAIGLLSSQAALAHAVVADATPEDKRAAGMGLLGAVFSVGFTIGPLGGALIAKYWSFHALGYIMAGLQGIALLLIIFALPETLPRREEHARIRIPILSGEVWRSVLGQSAVAGLLGASVIATLGYSEFFTAMPLAAGEWFDYDVMAVGKVFAVLGLVGAIAQGGLIRPLVKRIGERAVAIGGLMLVAAGYVWMAAGPGLGGFWISSILIGLGGGLATPSITGLLSRTGSSGDQGTILGMNQALMGIGRSAGFVIGSVLFVRVAHWVPFTVAATCLAGGCLLLAALKLKPTPAATAGEPAI
ncbi:MFS transporter [bacterium]|nr:MFS transporter [bacterium]